MDNQEQPRVRTKLTDAVLKHRRNILDARDKALRQKQDRQTDLTTAVAIVGTCPDMCPEQERYFRIDTNQVSPFEMVGDIVDEMRMVKEYRRSGADQEEPLSNELRPINVLERTMEYLCLEIVDQYDTYPNIGEWFDFVWSRTRSIRKDITQQHLVNLRSVALIEKCARFHIFCAYYLCEEEIKDFDPKINEENLNNCLQTLKDFYHDLSIRSIYCDSEAEFRSYDILLNLGNGETLSELKHFRSSIKNSSHISLAIKLYQAFDCKNHIKFFKYARQADFFKSCILNRYFYQFRIQALNIQCKAYTIPKSSAMVGYPINDVIKFMAFDDSNELKYLCDYIGLKYDEMNIYFQRNLVIEDVNLKIRSKSLVMEKLKLTAGKAILGLTDSNEFIQSQILPVTSSFDNKNDLIGDDNYQLMNINQSNNDTATSDPEVKSKEKINFSNFNFLPITSNTFQNQFEKLSKNEQPLFNKNDLFRQPAQGFSFSLSNIQNSNLIFPPNRIESQPFPAMITKATEENSLNYEKILNELKNDTFNELMEMLIKNECKLIAEKQMALNKIIKDESIDIFNTYLTDLIRQIVEQFVNETKLLRKEIIQCSNSIYEEFLELIIESIVKQTYQDKLKRLNESIKLYSDYFFEELFKEILKIFIDELITDIRMVRDEQIREFRTQTLYKKYWNKWRCYFLFNKRYKYYCEHFPAASIDNENSMDECSLLPNNKPLLIDDIQMKNSLKRKLAYSYNYEQLINNNKKRIKLKTNDKPWDLNVIEREYYLEKKYFKRWLHKVYRIKMKKIQLEFPSIWLNGTTTDSSDLQLTMNRFNNEMNGKAESIHYKHGFTLNENDRIKENLLQKLNYDYNSTVAMVKDLLNQCRNRRRESANKLSES